MILSLKIKNFLSFKDEVTFSFEATKDQHLEEYQIVEVTPGVRISKLGIVYGANASGKSNLIDAFSFLRTFFFRTPESKDDQTNSVPFLLDEYSRNNPSEFELIFFIESKKYIYTLKITESNVVSESLLHYPGIRPAEIFTRELNQNISLIRFNPKIKISNIAKEEIQVKCLSNMSIFSAYNKVNVQLIEMDIVVNWIKQQFMNSIWPNSGLLEQAKDLILKGNSNKSYILNFLNQADFNIKNIEVQSNNKELDDATVTELIRISDFPKSVNEQIEKIRAVKIEKILFSHTVIDENDVESVFKLPVNLQSGGTIRAMELSGVLSQVIEQNAFVAIDEIESSLHPKLIEFIIETFLKQSKTAQLLLTTHYDGLLEEEDLLRSDSIWFTNKRKDGSTELYSLCDFKGLNRISSLQKAYKFGKFGAIPNI
jgi:AAA15 family ATPase/GTPase